jgi:hypothetical protein
MHDYVNRAVKFQVWYFLLIKNKTIPTIKPTKPLIISLGRIFKSLIGKIVIMTAMLMGMIKAYAHFVFSY